MAPIPKAVVLIVLVGLSSAILAAPTDHISAVLHQNRKCPINSVCFAVDQSGSVRGFYPQEQQFVVEIAREIASRTSGTLYSAYGFSSGSRAIQTSTPDLENTFIPAVNKPVNPIGGTNMGRGLSACFNEIKNNQGNRLIVLVTDGIDNGSPRASMVAPDIKVAGVSIVTVGIGNSIQESYLEGLASGPEFFVKSSSFSTLLSKVVDVVEGSCKAAVTPRPTAPDVCAEAYDACDFKFVRRDTVPTFSVTGKSDKPFTPKIVSRMNGERIGVLNSNGIVPEFILADGSVQDITEAGASPKFRPTHFKPFSKKKKNGSGIGHQKYHGNQKMIARGQCIRVYFSTYQVLTGRPPYVKKNVNVDKTDNKCVVFKSA